MNSSNAILGLLTETSLHAGAGQALGVIDLPIQREAHTAWPCVFGSAVKGALRARAEGDKDSEKSLLADEINLIFGQADFKAGESSEYAGAVSVGDARLLLLPVRSLTTHFRWVTCPAALTRFQRDAKRLSIAELGDFEVPDVDGETALVAEAVNGGHLFLDEYRFRVDSDQAEALGKIVTALAKLMPESAGEALSHQFTIVADDFFRHLAEHATPVNAHVTLDNQTKTVKGGMLWYEETLPPETLLYVGLNAVASRRKDGETKPTAADVMARLREALFGEHPYLQLGGNETVGMGWCRAAFLPKQEA